jgi:hypothetical protein
MARASPGLHADGDPVYPPDDLVLGVKIQWLGG